VSCSATISNNTITSNAADDQGAGIDCYYANASIINNFIANNYVIQTGWTFIGGGGLMFVGPNSTPSVVGNVIVNNSSAYGGAVLCYSASPIFVNNTIVNNQATMYGGAFSCAESNPMIRNCILHGNTAPLLGKQVHLGDEQSDPGFFYCDVQGGTADFALNGSTYSGAYQNNISLPPSCVWPSGGSGTGFNGSAGSWMLQNTSPCINAGDPLGTYPLTDYAGNARVVSGCVDMGAYEFSPVSGVNEFQPDKEFTLFPNPTTGRITVMLPPGETQELELFNDTGVKIYSKKVSEATEVDLSPQANGIYILRYGTTIPLKRS
jgi:hypothetical protein